MSTLRAGGECVAAAWLCICVLEPDHLLRLRARGAPINEVCQPGMPFAMEDMVDGLLVGADQGPAHIHGFPQAQDVMDALRSAIRAYAGAPSSNWASESNWVEHTDDTTGLPFYRDRATGETMAWPEGRDGANSVPAWAPDLSAEASRLLSQGPVVRDAPSMLSTFVPVVLVWSPATHAAFPRPARERAVELLVIGAALARSSGGLSVIPIELWVTLIMPHVVRRRSWSGPDYAGREGVRGEW